jgi:hypothetical protein
VQLRLVGVGAIAVVKLTAYPSQGSWRANDWWQVFNAGDVLQLQKDVAGDVGYVLSGSLLYV